MVPLLPVAADIVPEPVRVAARISTLPPVPMYVSLSALTAEIVPSQTTVPETSR